jgi:hypothetical protein
MKRRKLLEPRVSGVEGLSAGLVALLEHVASRMGKPLEVVDHRRSPFPEDHGIPGIPPRFSVDPNQSSIVLRAQLGHPDAERAIANLAVKQELLSEGYPLARFNPGSFRRFASMAKSESLESVFEIGPLQEWTYNSLIDFVSSQRVRSMGLGVEQLRGHPLRLNEFLAGLESRLSSDTARKIAAMELALAVMEQRRVELYGRRVDWEQCVAAYPGITTEAEALRAIITRWDLLSPAGFMSCFRDILGRWGVRHFVVLGVVRGRNGRVKDIPWP